MEQIIFSECVTCKNCIYGRDLGSNEYGCRSEMRNAEKLKMVNDQNYNCQFAEIK
jgi:hypothetical protein